MSTQKLNNNLPEIRFCRHHNADIFALSKGGNK
jgi:hypothetical protein